jgi:hypothetical protein
MVWGLGFAVWQMGHFWSPGPGVGVGEVIGVAVGCAAWETDAAASQNDRVNPRTKSRAETKVASLAGRKLLIPQENVFFIRVLLVVKPVSGVGCN